MPASGTAARLIRMVRPFAPVSFEYEKSSICKRALCSHRDRSARFPGVAAADVKQGTASYGGPPDKDAHYSCALALPRAAGRCHPVVYWHRLAPLDLRTQQWLSQQFGDSAPGRLRTGALRLGDYTARVIF